MNKKILLLEDQGIVRAGIRELILLIDHDAEIFDVGTSDRAIEILEQEFFHFAILDIHLKTHLDGRGVLKFIKAKEFSTRVLMLSGIANKELIVECLTLGASGFISKDVEYDHLFRNALETFFQGGFFIPLIRVQNEIEVATNFQISPAISPEIFGIRGRSLEVLTYLCQGYTNKLIAKKMGVEEGTIRGDYVPKLFRIFNVSRRTELLVEVSRVGLRLPDIDGEY